MKNKKIHIVLFSFFVMALIGVSTAEAITYSNSSDYWTTWRNNLTSRTNATTRYRSSRRRSINWGPGYYRSKNRSVKPVSTSTIPYRSKATYPTYNSRSRMTTPTVKSKYVLGVSVISTEQSQPIAIIDKTPIRVFQLGVNNKSTVRKNSFAEALKLDTMTFQMFSNTGIAADPRMFELGVSETSGNGEPTYFQFNRNGKVTLKFNNARVAKGEGIELGIDVRVENTANTPRIPGAFKLRLLSATASTEQGGTRVTPQIVKNPLSENIAFTPGAAVSTGETPIVGTTSSSTEIFGRIVSASERVFALALNFEAHYDDMIIEEITVHNEIAGNDIDKYVDNVYLIDTVSGQTLGQAKFTQGTATFRLFSPFRVNREQERHIGFKIQIEDRVDTGRYDTRFRLGVAPSGVVVRGIGSGRTLPDSYKNFFTDTHTFLAVQYGGGVEIKPSSVQPSGFSVTENMERIYQFKISNPDVKEISIGRLSLDVRLFGMDFSGGRSADDFELKQMERGREISGEAFIPTVGSGNTITFDTGTELRIPRHGEMEFALKAKLVDIVSGNSDMDSVFVQILGDSTLTTGKLETIRANNAQFIWSDHSGRPHTLNSTDWLSGYKISGLPTSTTRNYRSRR